MKSLLKYLKEYRKEAVLAPLFKLLEATFELIVPLVMAAIIDTGIGTQNHNIRVGCCLFHQHIADGLTIGNPSYRP